MSSEGDVFDDYYKMRAERWSATYAIADLLRPIAISEHRWSCINDITRGGKGMKKLLILDEEYVTLMSIIKAALETEDGGPRHDEYSTLYHTLNAYRMHKEG